jgi:FkbM family methyltransferase
MLDPAEHRPKVLLPRRYVAGMAFPSAGRRETIARLALPGIVTDLRRMRRFAREHGVRLRGPGGYRRFRAARRFGLDLLPPGALAGHVLDVGANEGQFAGALLGVAPAARLTAFEPEPRTAVRLRARFGSREGVAIHELALGRSAGTADLHVTGNTVFASLHRPLGGLTAQYPRGADLTGTVTVPVAALDDVVAGPVSLLKIDVQGGEREVLAGARRVLSETAAVLLEVTFVPHYEDEATFGELHALLLAASFRLHALGDLQRSAGTGEVLWADACYVAGSPGAGR